MKDIENIQSELLSFEKGILEGKKHKMFCEVWTDIFPRKGGVYVVWVNNTPVYAGETSNPKDRMSDIRRCHNHSFTKKISKEVVRSLDSEKIRSFMRRNYKVSYIEIIFGRKEVEEYLITKWKIFIYFLYNMQLSIYRCCFV